MSDERPQWEIAKERHQNAERGPGRTAGPHVGDEFHDGHRLRQYPLSGRSGFIEEYKTFCDACAEQTYGSTSRAGKHWAAPADNCAHPEHAFNVSVAGVEQPTEYEQHKDNPDVVGWTKDNYGSGPDHTLCTSCAEDRRSTGQSLEPYYPLVKSRLMPKDDCSECGHSLHNGRKEASMKTQAYGETKAPVAVDTLRDENCPVCGEHDAYDGDQCQVCGFVTPPKMFQDPDLDKAKTLDLRANPATGTPNDTDPNLPPVDPTAVDGDGNVAGNVEPGAEGEEASTMQDDDDSEQGVVDGEVRSLGDEADPNAPVDPDAVDEEGNVGGPEDPEAADVHVNQGGEPFTQGPNAPQPGEPQEFMENPEGEEVAEDGQEVAEEAPVAGTPGDGMPDLLCPSCGFEADAAHPTSTPGNALEPANAGDGMLGGDVCPQCQKATLMSVGEVQEMGQMQPGVVR